MNAEIDQQDFNLLHKLHNFQTYQRIQKKRQESKISVKETEPCQFTEEVSKAREKHAKLMIKLLERYKDKVKDESEEHNKGIETIKQDLVRHLESMLSVK